MENFLFYGSGDQTDDYSVCHPTYDITIFISQFGKIYHLWKKITKSIYIYGIFI